jgi:pyruvate dehydrogenase E2 component (dihydrolipoamide acetyltransferase)
MDTQTTAATEVKVPDIGDFKDVAIIDIHVKVGDAVNAEDPLITLESDKATMDVPAPSAGTIRQVLVKVGDRVSEGKPIVLLASNEEGAMQQPTSLVPQQEPEPAPSAAATLTPPDRSAAVARRPTSPACTPDRACVASRARWAYLTKVTGTRRDRITRTTSWRSCAAPRHPRRARSGRWRQASRKSRAGLLKFGPIETKPLSRIKRLSGPFLHRSWLNVPHVTRNDEADVTETDAFRKELDTAQGEGLPRPLLALPDQAASRRSSGTRS